MANAVNDYNNLLFDDQVNQVYEKSELDAQQLHVDYVKARGHVGAQQAASGTTMGVGSNKDVMVDMTAEEALFDLIISKNAVSQANSILNAKAQGTWQTEMEIQKMQYEGQLSGISMMYNANADAQATLFGGLMGAYNAQQQGANQATASLMAGAQTASNHNAQASMYMTQGLMSGASSALQAYSAVPAATSSTAAAQIQEASRPASATMNELTTPSNNGISGDYGPFSLLS